MMELVKKELNPHHPRSTFTFWVSGSQLSDEVLSLMQSALVAVSNSRTWVIGPPELADENDGEVRMIGGSLDLYTAIPPFGSQLPKEVDRSHLEEVSAIVAALASFSKETGLELSLALDQTYVGRIKNGEADKLIQVGLLGEWRKRHT
jgi:hypothetical protein